MREKDTHHLWNDYLKRIRELLFPPRCPVCDEVLGAQDRQRLICRDCAGKISFIHEPRCLKCGMALEDETEEYCSSCKKRRHIYDSGLALFEYSPLRTSMYRFKYSGRAEYAKFYGRAAARYLGEQIRKWQPEGVIPVPMYAPKERMRGYNQAELFARALGNELSIPVYNDIVIRRRKTSPMKRLNARQRHVNLKNAFIIGRNDVKLRRVLVVDDIYTTGSTIDAVAAVLKASGTEKVFFVTLSGGNGI